MLVLDRKNVNELNYMLNKVNVRNLNKIEYKSYSRLQRIVSKEIQTTKDIMTVKELNSIFF